MTPDECEDFKKEILREIETHKINIYEFPDHDDEEENRFVPTKYMTHSISYNSNGIGFRRILEIRLPVYIF